ncbi:ArsR family transcriptional regulator [Amorphoplanes digitatis]|uniref:Protein-tyrosine-phosphatase/DNA-binding transcriptional ArsR family regulator n=1 Tax=Actinoplanes digitatis TaxID=1868 RepID=A0A7W7HW84_9ACTN|nr:ArsR family transcriptional regulator [Actinoplanes digitatis]MBB4761942.1 protein-tyrosine-phosphatase/DNA-binding transcriptional ArsR family regulator [Actinoplanes digitatis]GID91054.1 ArsR family transcriptional regulator [Actinoplanes digitatis]
MVDPPIFLHAAGHPVRWRLLSELATSDRQVHELTALLDQPQSLVSYHLGRLRKAELVGARRSTADGRDTFYRLDLARCGELLAATGAALHPALRMAQPSPPSPVRASVLFLCTGNSSRSQMAEALLRRAAGPAVEAHSAGSHPKPLHAYAMELFPELGTARPKHFDELAGRHFDHVITLCDRVREICPEFPGHPPAVHWSIPDPARDPDGLPAFARTAAELGTRIEFLLHRIAARQPPEAS